MMQSSDRQPEAVKLLEAEHDAAFEALRVARRARQAVPDGHEHHEARLQAVNDLAAATAAEECAAKALADAEAASKQ
jgi:hypothetical protein